MSSTIASSPQVVPIGEDRAHLVKCDVTFLEHDLPDSTDAAFGPLFFAKHWPELEGMKELIVLDCDILCRGDIFELWDTELEENVVMGAVVDFGYPGAQWTAQKRDDKHPAAGQRKTTPMASTWGEAEKSLAIEKCLQILLQDCPPAHPGAVETILEADPADLLGQEDLVELLGDVDVKTTHLPAGKVYLVRSTSMFTGRDLPRISEFQVPDKGRRSGPQQFCTQPKKRNSPDEPEETHRLRKKLVKRHIVYPSEGGKRTCNQWSLRDGSDVLVHPISFQPTGSDSIAHLNDVPNTLHEPGSDCWLNELFGLGLGLL